MKCFLIPDRARRMAARTPVAALAHGRVREAGRTHGRCNTTALAISLKYRELAGPDPKKLAPRPGLIKVVAAPMQSEAASHGLVADHPGMPGLS